MTSKVNRACTLKVGQIEKDPILALGMSEKDIEKYGRVAKAFGNVVPAIVGRSGKSYRILSGQAKLEACAKNGIREIPAIIADACSEAEQMKLALLLSTVREEGGPLSEGAFIETLSTQYGVTRRELMALLKKSKSWISKRQQLATRLTDEIKEMVRDGSVCARTAEEIAKLPKEIQVPFACRVVMDGLNKTNAGQLVSLYTAEDTGELMREAILATPFAVLDAAADMRISRRKEKRGFSERIVGTAGFLIRMACQLKELLATADGQSINMASADLVALRSALSDLLTTMELHVGVSPGKPLGGEML